MSTAPAYELTSTERVTEAFLLDVVERLAAEPQRWRPLVAESPDGAQWAPLSVPEDLEVFVVTWPTFRRTDLHSHDEATSAFAVVEGGVTEIRPDQRGRLVPRKFVEGASQVVRAGEVHDLRNEQAAPAVSIHAYAPRRSTVTYWRWERGAVTLDRVGRPADLDTAW